MAYGNDEQRSHAEKDAPKEVPLRCAPKEVPLGCAPKEVPLGCAVSCFDISESRY
jgi:hypothetical protein